ncbi:MAG: NUDIX hydrolase [Elusimicrobia bacterium]|nr:NUDIX hydrolase [Elusimicrobiota bacterium]MDE2236588.1 NUDIX hydrolase [Elusimicrobiota bacterium]MDE2426048.1 NUDIX hydrolase [Elusimicrobiota bacterium]
MPTQPTGVRMIQLGRPLRPERFSCRIYGVLRRGPRVLMARSHFIRQEFVNFPGGGVELGEAPIEALKREYREETGLEIAPARVLYASEGAHPSSHAPMQIVSIYWLVESVGGALREGGNGDDVIDLFWAELASIPTAEMFPSDLEFAARLPTLLR